MNDPILDEIRKFRDEYAARFNYDLDAIFRDIKEQEKKSGRRFGPDGIGLPATTTDGTKAARAVSDNGAK